MGSGVVGWWGGGVLVLICRSVTDLWLYCLCSSRCTAAILPLSHRCHRVVLRVTASPHNRPLGGPDVAPVSTALPAACPCPPRLTSTSTCTRTLFGRQRLRRKTRKFLTDSIHGLFSNRMKRKSSPYTSLAVTNNTSSVLVVPAQSNSKATHGCVHATVTRRGG